MKKIVTALLAVLIFAAAALAADYPAKLAITYVKAPLNVPSIVAKYNKSFEAAYPGVALSFPELTEGPKQTAALAAGEIGIASCLGATSALLAASEGLDIKIVGIYSRAPKAFMIVVKDPAIKSVRDLKGKKVAGPKGTILHQLLAAALEKEGMTVKDVQFIQMDLPSGANALAKGSVDAALLAGPAAYNTLASGARMLKNGEGLVDATIVIATTEKFLKEYPKAVETFMETHKKSIEWMKKNPLAAKEMTQKETGLPMAGVEAMYPWYDFDPQIRKADIEELVRTQKFMLDNGLQRKKIDDVRKLVR
ncbi:MAG: NrtA/SsuA/CpmA family ABC transporter substrate-binding protein [Cloacibacillus porcorum]|uniref:ABC transporter substrate-binding protein n=1 Tax=Cloacibacillus porcorum TaxID=1197717 RepID=UPI0023556720|nr:NrtA/SsuA/CpmA family ABC transporter substrate-binding protein [Cloacibacillus porcorum]MCI5865672.1 NrtA/SsuA/CpmA family ABC transporter substrate-binding protein [Cloacibacillus porcorum]